MGATRLKMRRLATALITVGLTCAAPVPAAHSSATGTSDLAQIVDGATYRIETTYEKPDGTRIKKTKAALAGVPALVNVDDTGLNDILVELVPLPPVGKASLDVVRLPGAPSPARLSVEAVIDLPGGGEPKLAVGYDALKSGAPATFHAAADFALDTTKIVDVDVNVLGPKDDLALIGELFTEGEGGARTDPKRGRLEYSPVPAASGLRVEITPEGDGQLIDVTADSSAAARGKVVAVNVDGSEKQTLRATVADLPPTMNLDLEVPNPPVEPAEASCLGDNATEEEEGETPGRVKVTYDAPERVDSVTIDGTERFDGVICSDLHAEIRRMATHAEIVRDSESHVTLDAAQPIGVAAVAFARNGFEAKLPPPDPHTGIPTVNGFERFFFAVDPDRREDDVDGFNILQARVTGLSHVEFDAGDPAVARPLLIDARLRPGPLLILARRGVITGDENISVEIEDLPADPHLTALLPEKPELEPGEPLPPPAPELTEITYKGSAPIGKIELDAHNRHGLLKSEPAATDLEALIHGLPSESTLTVEKSPDTDGANPTSVASKLISFDANGAGDDGAAKPVDLVEVLLSDGTPEKPGEGLAPAHDGVVVRDLPDRFRVFARVHGLRAVGLEKFPRTTTLRLDALGRRVVDEAGEETFERKAFDVDVRKLATDSPCDPFTGENEQEFLRATLQQLQPSTELSLEDHGGCKGRSFHYEAAGETESLVLQTDIGDRVLLDARVEQLARRIDLCIAEDGTCTGGGRIADTSLELDASSQIRIPRLVDCVAVDNPGAPRTAADVCRDVSTFQADAQPVEFIREATIATIDHATYLGFEVESHKGGDDEGHLFFDTADVRDVSEKNDGTFLGGRIWRDSVNGPVIRGIIDPKFRADHRLAIIDGAGFAVDRTSGLIECGETTDLEANTAGLPSFDVTGRPCSDD